MLLWHGRRNSYTFFPCCPHYNTLRTTYLSKYQLIRWILLSLEIIRSNVSLIPSNHLIHTVMYGSNVFNFVSNKAIINETIQFIKTPGRFKKLKRSTEKALYILKRVPPVLVLIYLLLPCLYFIISVLASIH